jgi:flagellar biosynthesis regulator FlbT
MTDSIIVQGFWLNKGTSTLTLRIYPIHVVSMVFNKGYQSCIKIKRRTLLVIMNCFTQPEYSNDHEAVNRLVSKKNARFFGLMEDVIPNGIERKTLGCIRKKDGLNSSRPRLAICSWLPPRSPSTID